MKTLFQIIFVCYTCLILFVSFEYSEGNNERKLTNQRYKRYLSFSNISHFFVRFNFRDNMVPWNQYFAHAVGFKVSWDEPPDSFHPYHHLHRRTVYNNLEILLNRNGLEGFHCVRRAICDMEKITKPKGIYHKILKIIFKKKSTATDKWHNKSEQDCELSIASCPLSLLDVSTFTD
ncbi:uncharacterized protein LOC123722155 [Papilio machaon]|uniref:uncharacterized protein LOC123722155 n=1 Tax=Papilio machaon TaxID=76193 RepID=UPI001E662D35|nr:uncharacterized protein LOC123722155 [Papilio machaon]